MKCTVLQTYLLGVERCDRPPAEVQAHLAACSACRQWQRRLIQLERGAALLPVPPSTRKADVLHAIRTAPLPKADGPARDKNRGLQKVAVAFALAAALVVLAVGLYAWQRQQGVRAPAAPKPAGDPLLAKLVQRDLRLAAGATPRERVETLADMAGDLHGETKALAKEAREKDLADLAGMYSQVVREGIVKLAAQVPDGERQKVLEPIAGRLARAGREADQLAEQLPASSAAPVREMADAAREGNVELSRLLAVVVVQAIVLEPEAPAAPAAERAGSFHRNRGLIGRLVQSGLRLAVAENAVERANCCADLAEDLAEEIEQAAENREAARVAELGQHLSALLKQGVADNVRDRSDDVLRDTSLKRDLEKVGQRTTAVVKPLEEQLQRAADAENREQMQHALKAVHDGRTAVEQALRGEGKPRDADKSKGKSGRD